MFFHGEQRLYRHLTPHNVFLGVDGEVRLSLAALLQEPEDLMMHGLRRPEDSAFEFMAPERLRASIVSFPADVWSLGVTLMTAATGAVPRFTAGPRSLWGVVSTIQSGVVPTLPAEDHSAALRDFCAQCLAIEAQRGEQRWKSRRSAAARWSGGRGAAGCLSVALFRDGRHLSAHMAAGTRRA